MAEYINKADMWEAYGKAKDDIDMAEQFERLPTIDIVTCKDCKYRGEGYIHSTKWLPCMAVKTNNDWFCADGERRTE